MPPFSLQSRRGAFLAFGLLLLLAVISVLGTLRIQREATRWINHTHEVRERIDRTLSLLTDAETGQRGYLLTSDKSFLKPYEMAVAAISATLDDLQQLSVGNDVQKRALVAVRSDVHDKLAELAQALSLHDSGQPAAALVIVHLGRGAAIMERLRADLATMRTAEDELLRQRTARARDANIWTITAVVALGALAVLLLWLMRTLMARDAARIRESEERLATTVASVGDAVISTDAQGSLSG
jgi:CHASE3 domain sensor protein